MHLQIGTKIKVKWSIFMPPIDRVGHVAFALPVCLLKILTMVSGRAFIFHMCISCGKTPSFASRSRARSNIKVIFF